MNKKTTLILMMIISSFALHAIQAYDNKKSYVENITTQIELHKRTRPTSKNKLEYWLEDISNSVYYTSTNQNDFVELHANNESKTITNTLHKLNYLHANKHSLDFENPYAHTTQIEPYDINTHIKLLQNELFDLKAIPLLSNNYWYNGDVLATNNFVVSERVYEKILMLNLYETNENHLHMEMFETNKSQNVESINIFRTHSSIYLDGYLMHFDRRFNLWRIVEKIDFVSRWENEKLPE